MIENLRLDSRPGEKIFCCPNYPDRLWGTSVLLSKGQWQLVARRKTGGFEADQSPLPRAEVKTFLGHNSPLKKAHHLPETSASDFALTQQKIPEAKTSKFTAPI
jgi:hypothetical protein